MAPSKWSTQLLAGLQSSRWWREICQTCGSTHTTPRRRTRACHYTIYDCGGLAKVCIVLYCSIGGRRGLSHFIPLAADDASVTIANGFVARKHQPAAAPAAAAASSPKLALVWTAGLGSLSHDNISNSRM